MSRLIAAIESVPTYSRTENGAVTLATSTDRLLDFFYLMGASRGKDLRAEFSRAYTESPELTARALCYLRDAREGVGERELFRSLFKELIRENYKLACAVVDKLPEIGRWDDVVEAYMCGNDIVAQQAFVLINTALKDKNGLCAKWMPRKGYVAHELRKGLNMSPKQYRRTIVDLSNTVEQQLCAREFKNINYSHVPGIAAARYQATFARHDPEGYAKYKTALVKGDDPKVKVNAGAIFPYDVIKGLKRGDETVANAQWNALPDFTGGSTESVMCVVDSSGSMSSPIPNSNVSALDVALSLGLYLSERLRGPFKDTFITFSQNPKLQKLSGTLKNRMQGMNTGEVANTNLQGVFDLLLDTAVRNRLDDADLPSKILIISDMEFDQASAPQRYGYYGNAPAPATNFNVTRQKYAAAGYTMPQLVFWNVMARNAQNVPVKANQKDVALVSGFSPAVVKSVLGGKVVTPRDVMLETLMRERYNLE